MNNIKKVEAWESILRRYVKNEQDVEQAISKIGNDLRKDRAFVIAFAKVRKSIDPSFADQFRGPKVSEKSGIFGRRLRSVTLLVKREVSCRAACLIIGQGILCPEGEV